MQSIIYKAAKLLMMARVLSDEDMRHMYVWRAMEFVTAKARGYPFLTEDIVNEWRFWESHYARCGYETFSVEFLEEARMKCHDLHESKWHKKRHRAVRPVLHASRFRHNFLEGVSS